MGRLWDSGGDAIRALVSQGMDPMEAAVRHIQGVTGINDRRVIEQVLRGKDVYSVTPEDVYRAAAEAKLGVKMGPSLGAPKEYVPPVRPSEAGPPPQSFESRVQSDPEIRKTIAEYDPSLADSVSGGDSEAILDAYRQAASNDGVRPQRGLIPVGSTGPGVRGGLSGPGVLVDAGRGMIPAPPRGIPGQTRSLSVPRDQQAAESIANQFDNVFHTGQGVDARPRNTGTPLSDDGLDDMWQRPFTPRTPKPPTKSGRGAAVAAGAAAVGAGLALFPRDDEDASLTTDGTADLKAESKPAPQVAATKETPVPTAKKGPEDYSLQARALINRLNDMRRAAGGEVPEAPAMMKEINRLIELGNTQRRDPQYSHPQADPARDPYQQARDLIARVNQMYRHGATPNSPEVQQIMRQVRQLQSQGDAIRNRRVG